jgi:predicted protein tyrosine phosphatase
MTIWVTSLFDAGDVARRAGASRAVSLLSPGDDFPALPGIAPQRHLRVSMHDIRDESEGLVSPARGHVADIVAFLRAHDPDETLLVHCFAGVSRSTAAAFVAACLYNPETNEHDVAAALRAASPTAFPNTRIVAFADEILGRGGRMTSAVAGMGRGAVAEMAEPFSIPSKFGRSKS